MELFALTRTLIEIESITPNEKEIGEFLFTYLAALAERTQGIVERIEVEPDRFNLLATWGRPLVAMSTHMDTVPPYLPFREDNERIWGRGACDTKGLMAAMIKATESLLANGFRDFALLFVVGEERNSAGALKMREHERGCRYFINGEPTEGKLALGSKGVLRYEVIARGKMAHSAYPELGDSAINRLLDALTRVRAIALPSDPVLGQSTLNIGTLQGGRAPNVIADEARAELLLRLVDDGETTRAAIKHAAGEQVEAREILYLPAVHMEALPGYDTCVVAYATDIPMLQGPWGKPLLFGPGSIHVAHTSEEHIDKRELAAAVSQYENLVRQLLLRTAESGVNE